MLEHVRTHGRPKGLEVSSTGRLVGSAYARVTLLKKLAKNNF